MAERKTPMMAPDRVRIYLTLVPYLAERGQVSVAEAANDFGVSAEEMRAMAEKLTVIGLPGEGGYWQLDPDLFNINWDLLDAEDTIELTNTVALERAPRLSAREAAALLSGLQLTRTIPGVDPELVSSLVAKLTAGASQAPAEVIVAPAVADEARTVVSQALKAGKAVSFTYRAPDAAPTTRTVDPVKVHITSGEWYLQGWCHLRKAMRTFNLDRVSEIILTDISSTHAGAETAPLFSSSDDGTTAVIRFPTSVTPLVGEYLRGASIQPDGDFSRAELTIADAHALKRLAARRGGVVEIIEPADARMTAGEWAQAGLEQYGPTPPPPIS